MEINSLPHPQLTASARAHADRKFKFSAGYQRHPYLTLKVGLKDELWLQSMETKSIVAWDAVVKSWGFLGTEPAFLHPYLTNWTPEMLIIPSGRLQCAVVLRLLGGFILSSWRGRSFLPNIFQAQIWIPRVLIQEGLLHQFDGTPVFHRLLDFTQLAVCWV